jgi:hypothetical protein
VGDNVVDPKVAEPPTIPVIIDEPSENIATDVPQSVAEPPAFTAQTHCPLADTLARKISAVPPVLDKVVEPKMAEDSK